MTNAYTVIETVVKHLGYPRINPESLTALRDITRSDDWQAFDDCGYSYPEIRAASAKVWADFQAMFAPVE